MPQPARACATSARSRPGPTQAIARRLETWPAWRRGCATTEYALRCSSRPRSLISFAAQTRGLTALDAQIQADTDLETLKADVKSIVTDYRVDLLTVP